MTAPHRYRTARALGTGLARSAPAVTALLCLAGVYSFLAAVRPLWPDAPENLTWGERRVAGLAAAVTLGGFGLAAWASGRLIRAAAELIEGAADGAEAAVRTGYLVEAHVVPALVRAVAALERIADGPPPRGAEAVRRATAEGRWGRAEQLLEALGPGDPDAPALAEALARARAAEADDLRARLDAALDADDPGRAIDCRDALTRHLRGADLDDLDRRVVRRVAGLIRRRARSGAVTPDLAALAGRAADSFGDTAEGAALLAAVPDLRRRAGLCPDCARPHAGGGGPCPACRPRAGRPAPGARP